MTDSIEEFLTDLLGEIRLAASEEGDEQGMPEAFTGHMVEVLSEAGEFDDAVVASYQARGARASGFSISEDESTLWLLLTDFRGDLEVQSLGKAELEQHFRRMNGFLEKARDGLWKELEESMTSWDMAHRIAEVWSQVAEIRLVVLTNADLRTSIPGETKLDGKTVHHAAWDITRLHQLASSGRSQEPIAVDVLDLWESPIPCLGPNGDPGAYEAYMLVIPGELIARIYEVHGPRLLELNVRSFLQATEQGQPGHPGNDQERATALPRLQQRHLDDRGLGDRRRYSPAAGRGIAQINDLQIVNGGQTTASLHYAKVKTKTDLSDVVVQAKLSVVEPTLLMDLVPRISEFANSQNKVNMADFSANDPFHVEVERLSRTIWAPGRDGTSAMTRWFYERARGQYADAHARERTPAKQRQFKADPPVEPEVHQDRPGEVRKHLRPDPVDRRARGRTELP